MKKVSILKAVFLCSFILLSAQENPDSPVPAGKTGILNKYFPVEGLNQWQKSFDISDIPPGVYNIVVKGEDAAGNVYEAPPIDIRIDPESDRPVTVISYPSARMKISGSLTVLGSARDDDQVAYVEVKLGDGPFVRAQGSSFWSLDFPTGTLDDGFYTLTAKAFDVNGIEGKETRIGFHLNNKAPGIQITSHENGDPVSRKFSIQGTTTDQNGIKKFSYSLDDGAVWTEAGLKGKFSEGQGSFSVEIDSRKLDDGPRVLLFKSEDLLGNQSDGALLVLIDNSPPVIDIVYPPDGVSSPEGGMENGRFLVLGRARDDLGIAALSWSYKGGEPNPIPMEPGNPYWSALVDFTGKDKMELIFQVEDTTGNISTVVYKQPLDLAGDLPSVQLLHPRENDPTDLKVLRGWVLDDDAPAGLIYKVDKGDEVRIDSGRVFDIPLDEILPGPHTLTFRGVDVNGLEGNPQTLSFSFLPGQPDITVETVTGGTGDVLTYAPGIRFRSDEYSRIEGTVRFDSLAGKLRFTLPGGAETECRLTKTDEPGLYSFAVDLAEPVPFGFVPLKLAAEDSLGSRRETTAYLWIENLGKNQAAFGFHQPDVSRVILNEKDTYDFIFSGHPLTQAEISGGEEFLTLKNRSGRISLTPAAPGKAENLTVSGVTDRGILFTAKLPQIIADFAPPVIEILQAPGSFLSGREEVSGVVTDDLGGISLSFALGSGEYQPVQVRSGEKGWTFSIPVSSDTLPPQGTLLKLKALDDSGKTAYAYKVLVPRGSAGTPPKPSLTAFAGGDGPSVLPEALVEGRVFLGAALQGVENASSLTYSLNGGTPVPLSGFPGAETTLGRLDPGAHSVTLEALYGEGKKLTASLKFTLAEEQGVLSLSGFTAGDEITASSEGVINGEVSGSTRLQDVRFIMDKKDPVAVKFTQEPGRSLFTVPLRGLGYGRHDLTVNTVDIHGRTGSLSTFFYLLAPSRGRAVDDREGLYSLTDQPGTYRYFFNGRPIEAAGFDPPHPHFTLKTQGPVLMAQSSQPATDSGLELAVVTVDKETFRLGSLSLTTDITPPVLELLSPRPGLHVSGTLELSGTLSDDLAPASLAYSLNGSGFAPLELPTQGNSFSRTLELQGSADGPLEVKVKALDTAGNETLITRLLIKDTTPPRARQLLPLPDEEINGSTSVYFKVEDQWTEGTVTRFLLGEQTVESKDTSGFILLSPDFSPFTEIPGNFSLILQDTAGNIGEIVPAVLFNPQSDKPVVSLQYPGENALFESDPLFSGTVFDDDGVGSLRYTVDGGTPVNLPGGSSFEIRLPFSSLEDNEHTIEITATDLYGVDSDPLILPFRVSRAVPEASMLEPGLGTTNRKEIILSGTARDANGIGGVYLSFDNGNSYKKALGSEEWTYPLDSQILVDGTYMVLIKARDNYGVESISSSLLTVDNTPPRVEISQPADGSEVAEILPIQLRAEDELTVKQIRYQITLLDNPAGEESLPLMSGELENQWVILDELDVRDLVPGLYNLSIFAIDDALNETIVSRNFIRKPLDRAAKLSLLYPLSGSSLSSAFSITGRVEGDHIPPRVDLIVDGRVFDTLETNAQGYFSRSVTPGELPGGTLSLGAVMNTREGDPLESAPILVDYQAQGPWIQFTSLFTGDYVSRRPWVEGNSGYYSSETGENAPVLGKEERRARELERLEYSLDNGGSFTRFKTAQAWRFRLETQEIKDGPLSITVRATFKSGETVLDRVFVFADDTMPRVSVLTPRDGLAVNQNLMINGTAFDQNGLENVEVMIRPGSKNSYGVPQFIQGLYLDTHFLGATYWEVGVGLTFFDNNVKLQLLAGMSPPGRFNGAVFGFKLLANVASLPYGYFFGPDWDFLSSSLAVGSAFEYFTMSESPEQEGLVLGAVILQLELLKAEFRELKMFNAYSLYVENQLWFISSDIQGGLEYRLAFGLRTNVF